jgi:hypothetical protein
VRVNFEGFIYKAPNDTFVGESKEGKTCREWLTRYIHSISKPSPGFNVNKMMQV